MHKQFTSAQTIRATFQLGILAALRGIDMEVRKLVAKDSQQR